MNNNYGKLYIVSTPIGNLSDMTFRAIETLKNVDLIAAEDTRHTRELLNHFDIKKGLISFNEHTDPQKVENLIDKIKNGINVAVVSDAGTPIISDPGMVLTKLAIENDIEFTAIPGACAAINALVLSGLSAKTFTFIGFLSEDNKKRKEQLSNLVDKMETMIFYISSHNLKKDLKSLVEVFGEDRKAAISREMTKKFEETVRGSLTFISEYFDEKEARGEFVLVLDGADKNDLREKEINKWKEMTYAEHYAYYLNLGFSDKDALKKVAIDRGLKKNEVYKLLKVKEN